MSNLSQSGQKRRFQINDDDDGIDMSSDEASGGHDEDVVGVNHGGDDEDGVNRRHDEVVGVNHGGDDEDGVGVNHGGDDEDGDAGRMLLTANEKKSDDVIITILYMLHLQGHFVTLAKILRKKTKDKLNQGDYDSSVNRLVGGQYIEIKNEQLLKYAITKKGTEHYNKTIKQKKEFQKVRIDEANLNPEDQYLLKQNKKRFLKRKDFLLKLQSTMRSRGIDNDKITGMTEDDFLTMDVSNLDRLIDVLTSERIRSSLDEQIMDSLGVASVDTQLRNDIIFSAYAEMMVDEENEDEHNDEDQDTDSDDDNDNVDYDVDHDVDHGADHGANHGADRGVDVDYGVDDEQQIIEAVMAESLLLPREGVDQGVDYGVDDEQQIMEAVMAESLLLPREEAKLEPEVRNRRIFGYDYNGNVIYESSSDDDSSAHSMFDPNADADDDKHNLVIVDGTDAVALGAEVRRSKRQHAVRARSIMTATLTGKRNYVSKFDRTKNSNDRVKLNAIKYDCDCGQVKCTDRNNTVPHLRDNKTAHNYTKPSCITKAGICGILRKESQVQFEDLFMELYLQPLIEKYKNRAEKARQVGSFYNILDALSYDLPGETHLAVGLKDWNPTNFLVGTKLSCPRTKFGPNLEQRIVTVLSGIHPGFKITDVYNTGTASISGIHQKILTTVSDPVGGISPRNRLSLQNKNRKRKPRKNKKVKAGAVRTRGTKVQNMQRNLHRAVNNHKLSLTAYRTIITTTFDESCICKIDPNSDHCNLATYKEIWQKLRITGDMNRKIYASDYLDSGSYGILHATLIDPLGEKWKRWSPSESEKDVKGVLMSRVFLQIHFNLNFDGEAKKFDNNVWGSFSLEGCLRHIRNKKFKKKPIPDGTKIYLALITSVSPFFHKFHPHFIPNLELSVHGHETMVRTPCPQVVPDHWLVTTYEDEENLEWKELSGYDNQSSSI